MGCLQVRHKTYHLVVLGDIAQLIDAEEARQSVDVQRLGPGELQVLLVQVGLLNDRREPCTSSRSQGGTTHNAKPRSRALWLRASAPGRRLPS